MRLLFIILIIVSGPLSAQTKLDFLKPAPFSSTNNYRQTVLNLSPQIYYPLNETSGSTFDNAQGNSAYDGTFSSNIQFKRTWFLDNAVHFNGAYGNFYSSTFNTNFSRTTGTIGLWFRFTTKDDWVNSSAERLLSIEADDNNRFVIDITNSKVLRVLRIAGGTVKSASYDYSATTPLDWQCIVFTYSTVSDELKLFVNGVQSGSTVTGLTSFTGNLASTKVCIGAQTTGSGIPMVEGEIANVAIWNSVLTPTQITTFSTAPTYPDDNYLVHSIETSWDIFSLFGVTGESLAYFMYDVNSDGEKDLVANIGRRARFAAVEKDGTILWDNTVDNTQAEPTRFPFVRSGVMYFANQNKVYAIRLSDGVNVWTKTVITPAQTYIMINQQSTGLVVATGTKLDVLDWTTGNSIGGNFPVTLPWTAWEQSVCTGNIAGNEVIALNGHSTGETRVYNADGSLRFTYQAVYASGYHVDTYHFTDITGDGQNEIVFCTDTNASSTQVAGEGDELIALNASGSQVALFAGIATGGLQIESNNWSNGGKVAFSFESDYTTHRIQMLNSSFSAVFTYNAGTPYEGDQFILYDVDDDGQPEMLYSTEVFSSTSGFRVLRYDGTPVYFFSEDGPNVMDDVVDSRGSATSNHQYHDPYVVAQGELLQSVLRTTDNTGHEVIYLHKWSYQ